MARRPPIADRELLKLLEAGHGQSQAARAMGYPVGTVTARVKKLRERGILGPGDVVDWEALEAWDREHGPRSPRRPEADSPQDRPRKPTETAHTLTEDETQVLKEIVAYWRERKAHADGPQLPTPEGPQEPTEGPRTRRHVLVSDRLWRIARDRARAERVSVGEIMNRALTAYLE